MGGRGAAGPGDIILAGFRLFGDRWKEFLKIGALTMVPVTVVGVVATTSFTPAVVGDIMANQVTPSEIEHRLSGVGVDQWVRLGVAYGIYLIASWIVAGPPLLPWASQPSPSRSSRAGRGRCGSRRGPFRLLCWGCGCSSCSGSLFCR